LLLEFSNNLIFPRLDRESKSEQQPLKETSLIEPVHRAITSAKRSLKCVEFINKDAKHFPEVFKQAKAI
jgi:hypothetical protein